MRSALPDGQLVYSATVGDVSNPGGNYLTPFGTPSMAQVVDGNSDGNADQAVDYYGDPGDSYTGWTITINGNDYAIFETTSASGLSAFYRIPFFNETEDLSGFFGQPVVGVFTFRGDNASVVNLCFMEGTQIATPSGTQPVDALKIGDAVTTADGRAVRITWIGRQHVARPVNLAHRPHLIPVRIKAHALGPGRPNQDLIVSADHGLALEGYILTAAALVNGTTIQFVPEADLPKAFTYFHIETAHHDIILANGAPAETVCDAAGRAAFDNHQEYLDLYGADRLVPEMHMPRIASRRLTPHAIKEKLDGFAPTGCLKDSA